MAVFDLNYTPNHTKLGSSVNVKHFFSFLSSLLQSVLQGTCSNDGGNLQFFNVLSRPERCPIPLPKRDQIHPQLSKDLICPPPARPTPKLDWRIRRTSSALITTSQWRRLLCIHVLIMYIIGLCSSVSFQPVGLFCSFINSDNVSSNISKLLMISWRHLFLLITTFYHFGKKLSLVAGWH